MSSLITTVTTTTESIVVGLGDTTVSTLGMITNVTKAGQIQSSRLVDAAERAKADDLEQADDLSLARSMESAISLARRQVTIDKALAADKDLAAAYQAILKRRGL